MWPEKPPEPVLLQAAGLLSPGDALDVACGTGRHARALSALGWRVTAVDNSAVALELLRRNGADGIRVVQADLETGDYRIEAERYDLICDACFLHRPLFVQMRAGLRPGGVFAGVFPLEGINPAWLMKRGELSGYFAGWEIVHFAERRSGGSGRLRAEIIARRPAGR